MNYLITAVRQDGSEILGSDCQAILTDCTLIKVSNKIEKMKGHLAFHKAVRVKIYKYSQLYVQDTFRLVSERIINY